MNIKYLLIAVFLGFTSSIAHAATIWAPTNEDTDFIVLDFGDIDLNGATLALFDDGDIGFLNPLVIGNGSDGGEVWFDPPPPATGDILATSYDTDGNMTGSLLLSDSNEFTLAVTRDAGTSWLSDTSWEKVGTDSYLIRFNEEVPCGPDAVPGERCMDKAAVLGVDLQPIPVPAAVWLFGSGLLGLVGVARRRA